MTADRQVCAVWLSRALTAGSGSFPRLLRVFSSPEEIYHADERLLRTALGTLRADLPALLDRSLTDAIKDVRYCEATQTQIISYFDDAYPARLRKLASPPAVLYLRGTLPTEDTPSVAIVGSRRTSQKGRYETFRIAYGLARAGYATVSGLAKGMDGVAAAGTLALGGCSVAVLAGGVDTVYPRSHETLAEALVKSGALISEFPIGTRCLRYHFPIRNRLIAGMCDALLLTEGDVKSGSLITARIAMREGRKVFALRMKDEGYANGASDLLISEGALCVDGAKAFFDRLSIDSMENEPPDRGMTDRALFRFGVDLGANGGAEKNTDDAYASAASVSKEDIAAEGEEQTLDTRILTCLARMTEADLDQLCEQIDGVSPSSIQTALMMLSVSGKVEMIAGGRYRYIPA